MSQMKDYFLGLIESGDVDTLLKMGAPEWAIGEARLRSIREKEEVTPEDFVQCILNKK